MQKQRVKFEFATTIGTIKNAGNRYQINCSDGKAYNSSALLIATGGMSYPKTGSTGDGYAFAESLGHKIVSPKPALTDIRVSNHYLKRIIRYLF